MSNTKLELESTYDKKLKQIEIQEVNQKLSKDIVDYSLDIGSEQ